MANVTSLVKVVKTFMAVSHNVPILGERFDCHRLESQNGKYVFIPVTTSTVEVIQQLDNNIYLLKTKNSVYIVRIWRLSIDNLHFAIVNTLPKTGKHLNCNKVEFNSVNYRIRIKPVITSTILECQYIRGIDLYKIKTRNSTYMCFPM